MREVEALVKEYLDLRAEWLKVRGYLSDPNTGLPALPAVVEDVRRRVERGERVGLILLDLRSESQLEEVYGWEMYDSLIHQVADALRRVTILHLSESDVVAQMAVRSDEFVLFVGIPGRSGHERQELARIRDRVVHEVSAMLRVQVGHEKPRGLGIAAASGPIVYDPTVRIERLVYKVLDEVKARCRAERELHQTARLAELRRILAARDIRIRYQPILRLADRAVFGFEALSYGPAGDVFENPEMLFSFAEKTDQIIDLERLCRIESVRGAASLAPRSRLFLNCSVHGLSDTAFLAGPVLDVAAEHGYSASEIVLEITERVSAAVDDRLHTYLAELRRSGFAIAIDDMGAGYSSLHSVAEVEPDFLKLDLQLVRDIHRRPIKQDLLESLVGLASKIGAGVVAEGIEQEEELAVLTRMGVTYGQGFLFSPLAGLSSHAPAAVC